MENLEILKKAGLSDAQAEIYNALLVNGAMTPTELAGVTSQSRENSYAIVKKLADLELVEQIKDKKIKYRVLNPSNLEMLVEKRRKVMVKNEKFVKDSISSLLDIFYANNEMPGARTLEGIDGIKEVFKDTLRVKKDIYLLRTIADAVLSGPENGNYMHSYREQRALAGIHTYALTTVHPHSLKHAKTGRDMAVNYHRTWIPADAYTAPVEIDVYGDKVALLAFGETQMATIITSPVIAESMRQILKLMMDFYKKSFPQDQK